MKKGRDTIFVVIVIYVVLFIIIIGIYNHTKKILSYEYKDTSSTQWKIDKLLLDEENEDMISNVNVTSKRHRQESSNHRQSDTKKKKHKERSPEALDIYIRPIGGWGPNNQVLGLIFLWEFCRYYNLRTVDSVLCPHYTDRGEECLPISSLFEVARHRNTFKPVQRKEVDVIMASSNDTSQLKTFTRAGINPSAASIRVPPKGIGYDKMPLLTEWVKNGTIPRGSTIAMSKAISGQEALFNKKKSPHPWLKSLQEWKFDEPYLPVKKIRQQTMSELDALGLKSGSSGNFIAVHLRLWDQCFRNTYSGEYTLNICCCGRKMAKVNEDADESSLSKVLGEYTATKMEESNVKHALILGHPIMNDISENEGWIDGKKVVIWPQTGYKEEHPMITTIIQQYMMTMGKHLFVSTPKSTIVTPVEIWRSYHNMTHHEPIKLEGYGING